ncbi:MAG: hypothetical protein QOG87_1149 [Actinomycetota bacterium]|jgi:DNA-binding transcriptional MerR regulator
MVSHVPQGPWPIDEFARVAGTTVRNVRLYQERGLVPAPERRGRERALYGDEHLRRVRLVRTFLERGYPLAAIRDLIEAWEAKRSLGDVLGFEEALAEPFTSEEPRTFTLGELQALFPNDDGTGLARAIELGVLAPDGDDFLAPVPSLLRVGADLVADGVPLATVLAASEEIRVATQRLADVFVTLYLESVWEPFAAAGEPTEGWRDVTAALNRQREIWPRAVVPTLAYALEQRVNEAVRAVAAKDMPDTGSADPETS